MQTPALVTIVKMIEDLPESTQNQVADHLREYLLTLQDEALWDKQFANSQDKLAKMAQRAKQQMVQGLAKPMDYDKL